MASGQLSVSISAAENSSEKDLRNSRTLLKPLQAFPSSTQQASPAKSKANIEIPILIVSSESDFGPGSPVRHVREAPFSVSALEEQSTPSFNADLGNREARSAVQSETGDKLLAAGLCHGAVDRPEPGKYAPPMSPAMSAGPMEGTSPRPGSEDLETRSEKELAHAEGKGDNIAQDEQLTGGIARNGTLSGRSPLHPDTKSSPLPISGVQDLSSAGKRGPLPDRTEIPLPPYNPPIAQRDAKRATSASGRTPVSREGTSAETHQGTSGGNEQTGSVQLSTTGEVLSSPEAPAGSGPEPNHAESAEKRPQSVEPESSPGGSITKAVSASDEPLQREPPPEVTGSGRAREADLQLGADKPSMPGLPVREQDRPQKITAGPEQRGGVQQQPATPPPAQAQPTGWGNGRAANGAWQGSPGGSGSQRGLKSVSQQGEGPSGGVQMRRPQSGGHGRGGWQPPGRYSPQGLGKGGGFQGSMNHNATSAPGTNNVRRNGAVDNGGGRQRGQSRSPESPLNWGKPVSPNLEELPVAMSQPPVPQPLPPTLAGGAATHLTIEWQESPRCQFYFLDMALSVDRGVRDTGSSVGNGERLVGESLDWRPVYSGKDFKCQVTGLKPGQSYWFRVRYLPAATPPFAPPTPPPPSMPAFFWTQCSTPGPPTPPQLASRARSNLKVKWAPPPETGGKPVTHYQLRMRPPPAREESWSADPDGFVEIYQGSDTSFKVARLVPGRDYAFRVRGFNSIGAGAFSPEAIFSTQPSVPAQPEAPQMVAQTATSVTLRWEAPHSGGAEITEYVLEIDDGEGGAFAMVYTGPEMICEIQQLRAGFTYRCRVLAVNEVGRSTFSIPADVRTGRAEPFKLTPPVISCRGPTSLTLAWDPPEDDGGAEVEEYRVEIWHPRGGGWRVAYVGPARACSVTNLQPGQSYRVRVQAANQVGLSEWSGELRAMTSASAPDSLEPPVLGDSHQTAVLVQWAPPRHDGGSAVAGYRLEMGEGGGRSESFGRGRTVYSGLDTAVWVKELQPGCAYSFRIQTWNKLGSSPWTPPVVFHTLPGNPSSPGPPTLAPSAAITMTSTQLPLVWEPPAANGAPVLSYCLQMCMPVLSGHDTWRGERAPRPALADSSSSTDLAETARSSSDAFKPPGSKTAPPSETASVGTGSVDEDTAFDPGSFSEGGDGDGLLGSPGEDGISRKGLAGRASEWGAREELRFEDVEVCAGAAATVGGLMPHTLYAFRVRATNTVGSSEFSPVSYLLTASAEPEAPPPPTVVETGPDHVHLRWEKPARDNGESVESYSLEIERRSSNRTASSSASRVGVRPSKQRGARMVGIGGSTAAAVAAASKGEELWEEVYSGNVRECLVDTLDPGRPYRFRVRAWNAVGGSPPSASVQVRTDPAAPGAPPPPSFSAVTPTTVRVRWTPPEEDNGAPVRSYKLGADDGLGGAFRQVYEGSALKHTAARLVPGRTYLFRVQAISELGASAPSAPASVSLPRAPPRAPLAPVAKSANTSALVLVWEAPESEEEEERFSSRTGFTLQLEERGTFKTIYKGEEPSFEAKNLAPGTVYRFRVRSNGPPDMDPGPWSPTAALATDALLDVAAPRAHKSPSRLQNQLRTRLHVLHQEADRWQGLPMRRAVASLCVALVLIAAFLQWG